MHISIPRSRAIQWFTCISLGCYAILTMTNLLGYIKPLHRRKGTVDIVLSSILAATVCRQRQGRGALPHAPIEPERYTETPYCQETHLPDIYDVVVAQVDGRDHETHRNHQQG